MNYNNMGGHAPSGIPNGHHPLPPQQPGSIGSDEQQQMAPSQADPSADPYRQQPQQLPGQYNNQQQMG